ncbi:MAG TPA: MerR family transcriptional regulator [Candidatus Sulfotelmatobacter sp.]|nr:MerR family transcriptional regulator [Candidatus Sulfotelmatobacter sp.]
MIIAEDTELTAQRRAGKSEAAFRTISEVSEDLDVPQHVLRFWESKFPQIKPLKRGGGRRYYRPEDVALLRRIRDLLYKDGYTIKGVQKLLREQGRSLADEAEAIAAEAKAAPKPVRAPRASRAKVDPLPSVEADEEIIVGTPDSPQNSLFEAAPEAPRQHPLFDLDAAMRRIQPDPSSLPPIEDVSPQPEFELEPRVWVQPEPQRPLSPTSPHFRAGDRAELMGILSELEELRELLSTSRRGG